MKTRKHKKKDERKPTPEKMCDICGGALRRHDGIERENELREWLRREEKFKHFARHPVATTNRLRALNAVNEEDVQARKVKYEKELAKLEKK